MRDALDLDKVRSLELLDTAFRELLPDYAVPHLPNITQAVVLEFGPGLASAQPCSVRTTASATRLTCAPARTGQRLGSERVRNEPLGHPTAPKRVNTANASTPGVNVPERLAEHGLNVG